MKILVDARQISGKNGGVQQAIQGLAYSFKEADFVDLEFVWLMYDGHSNWLEEYLPRKSSVFLLKSPKSRKSLITKFVNLVRRIKYLELVVAKSRIFKPFKFELPDMDKFILDLKPDLVHFTSQFGFSTRLPNIYQPHDLQHLHFPKYFTAENIYAREIIYTKMIKQANCVVVGNQWTLDDFLDNFKDLKNKIYNVPVYFRPLPKETKTNILQTKFTNYVYYPAAGWPHKNHAILFEAIALLKERKVEVKLVLTGALLVTNKSICKLIEKFNLSEDVEILGYVSDSQQSEIFKNSSLIVIPTLFESASFPVWEAFYFSKPVLVSNVTSLPSQVQGAAMLFDPNNANELAERISEFLTNSNLSQEYSNRGKERLVKLTPFNTALGYRFVYRRSLDANLDELDELWLSNGFWF